MRELQVLDDDAGLDDVALAVDQQRELAQPAAIYASPLAFEWWPQAPAEGTFELSRCRLQSGHPRVQ